MKAIKKLNIIFKITILSMIIPFFYFQFKRNINWGIAFITIFLIFILLRLFIFRKKYQDLEEDYTWVPLSYVFGGMLLLLAVIGSIGTIKDWEHIHSMPLWLILFLSGAWILGFLLIYYAYKSKKESVLVTKKKEKTKEIISKEKIKKFWIYYLISFMIVAAIIRYIFKVIPFTLINVIITVSIIAFMYFYLRIAFSTKKYKLLFVILVFLLIFFGTFTYILITSHKTTTYRPTLIVENSYKLGEEVNILVKTNGKIYITPSDYWSSLSSWVIVKKIDNEWHRLKLDKECLAPCETICETGPIACIAGATVPACKIADSLEIFNWRQRVFISKEIDCPNFGRLTCLEEKLVEPGLYKIMFHFKTNCSSGLWQDEDEKIKVIGKEFEIVK